MRYLKRQEKTRTLPLWREAFPEDSEEFLEYYYTEKTADNRILAEEEEGRIVSMLHRNPYPVWAGSRRWNSDYVVAVATARDRRGRGLMRRLLGSALADMFQEGMEFCFLMPADRRLYEPFGFAYVYDQPYLALTPEAERRLRRCVADDRTLPAAAAYMEEWLQNRREVRTVRDEAYVRRLAAELESENGCLEILLEPEKDGNAGFLAGRIAGVRGIQGGKQRFLLCGEENCEEAEPAAPAIMARIVCLERFLKAVRLKEESRLPGLAVRLTVTDPVCAGNQGTFLWELDKETSRITRIPDGEGPGSGQEIPRLEVQIGALTGWLFGYGEAPAAEPWIQEVRVLQGVFLDEEV